MGCDSVDQYMGNAEKLRTASPNICKLYTLSISHSGSNKIKNNNKKFICECHIQIQLKKISDKENLVFFENDLIHLK